ncbi:MAG: ABC transporter ATP-binding protein [Eubacteriales bacterium]|nr:ABC transporter ATP-binding protein [Eubacteriales bacterium]MDD4389788.1 ABC transporter ATP-binding protein [Eubacteriales bacterium]
MTNNYIILKNIYKSFGENEVLKCINFCILKGEIYGLLGPSGCGKTTAVKIAAGMLKASAGEAFVLDTRMPDLQTLDKIGYMAQSDALYSNLSGRENMSFLGALYGMKKPELDERIEYAAKVVDLTEHLEKKVSDYSGGMKRRLSLAGVILHDPDVLILDEPTVGIDPLLRKSIWDELYRMADAGKAILVTTHVMDEADKCTRLSMMRDGSLIKEGSPEEIKKDAGANTMDEAFIFYSRGEAQNED